MGERGNMYRLNNNAGRSDMERNRLENPEIKRLYIAILRPKKKMQRGIFTRKGQ